MATEVINAEMIFGIVSAIVAIVSLGGNVVQAYKKGGLSAAIAEINEFFTMHNTTTTDAPKELDNQTYQMEDETKESIYALLEEDERVKALEEIAAHQESGIVSYTLDFRNWFIKIDYGQITVITHKSSETLFEDGNNQASAVSNGA